MPTKPTTVPSRLSAAGRSRAAKRRQTSHSGVAATSSAAIPDGTVCSATATPPLPPSRSRSPTVAAAAELARTDPQRARPLAHRDDRAEQQAGEQEAGAHRQQRRDGLHDHPDRQVGRAPDEVDGDKGDPDGQRARPPPGLACHEHQPPSLLSR